jgi:predicted permease
MNSVKYALRGLWRDAGYAITVVLTLALTIGAATATFSIVDGVLLKPLRYREAHQLVAIKEVALELQNRFPVLPINARHFGEWRSQATTFDALVEFLPMQANLTGAGDAVQIAIVRTTGGLDEVLQVKPVLGRSLTREDEPEGRADVVVLGNAIWRERFGADPSILGRAVAIDGKPHTVVGVLPAGFELPEPPKLLGSVQLVSAVDALVPLRVPANAGWSGDFNYSVLGRLKSGTSIEQARADLDVIQRRVSQRMSDEAHQTITMRTNVAGLADAVIGGARRGLVLLLGAVGAVLLIACSNLVNLSLTRRTGRLRDALIRTALGASRGRLIQDVVTEQLLLAAAGGILGLAVAWAALRLFVLTAPIELPRAGEVALDPRVLLFAAGLSVLVGLLTAIVPAWSLTGRRLNAPLRAAGLAATADAGTLQARGTLLAAQVGLSVVLLVVTVLLGISFMHVLRLDRGFSAERVLAVDVALPAARFEKLPERVAAFDRVIAAARTVPGVDAASYTSILPLQGEDSNNPISVAGDTRAIFDRPIANFRFVSPDFFRTLAIPIRRGRPIADDDRREDRATLPAVISDATAARVWPGQDAIGKRFLRGPDEKPFEVVGLVGDVRLTSLDGVPPLMVYIPYWSRSRASAALLVHTHVDPESVASAVRRALQAADPQIAIGAIRPLDRLVGSATAVRRYQVLLFSTFGAAALAIALVGVYGVTAYGVARRRREMNIRTALGAQRSQVMRMVLAQGSVPIVAGAVAGAIAAVAAGGVLAGLLFEMQARNPWVISGVAILVPAIALLAAAGAARQGLVLDPAAALRDE